MVKLTFNLTKLLLVERLFVVRAGAFDEQEISSSALTALAEHALIGGFYQGIAESRFTGENGDAARFENPLEFPAGPLDFQVMQNRAAIDHVEELVCETQLVQILDGAVNINLVVSRDGLGIGDGRFGNVHGVDDGPGVCGLHGGYSRSTRADQNCFPGQ